MALVVFGTLFGVSIYAGVDSHCESFTIDRTSLTVRTLHGLRYFDLSNLCRLEWRVRPRAGAILFHLPDSQVQQRLLNYSDDDGLKIIRALREMVPEEKQEGWSQFCYKIALPLRDGISAFARAQPPLALYTITRGQYDRKFVIVFPISIVMAVALGVWTNIWELCALPVLVTVWWLIARFSIPPGGQCEVRLTSTASGRIILIALGLLFVAMILIQGLAVYGVEKESACGIAMLVLLPAFPLIFYSAYKDQKLMEAAESAGREQAAIEWQRSQDANK